MKMKKNFFALSFLLCAFSVSAQNTWNSLSNSQAVSWAALQDAVNTGVFAWGGTAFPTSNTNQCLYKNLATVTNYAAVTLNSSRATNDLLVKSDFTAANYCYSANAGNYPSWMQIFNQTGGSLSSPSNWIGYSSSCSNFSVNPYIPYNTYISICPSGCDYNYSAIFTTGANSVGITNTVSSFLISVTGNWYINNSSGIILSGNVDGVTIPSGKSGNVGFNLPATSSLNSVQIQLYINIVQ